MPNNDEPIRTAKMGSSWTEKELADYSVVFKYVDSETFFGVQVLPEPKINEELITVESAKDMNDMHSCILMNLLDLAMSPTGRAESRVDDFAASLLFNLGYVSRTRVAQAQTDLPLLMCGSMMNTQTDVRILDRAGNEILLLVQEGGRTTATLDARPQLIAGAIAAFQYNNFQRRLIGKTELTSKEMPGIIMVGTAAIFYRIPITTELIRSVRHGVRPNIETIVLAHIPEIPRPHRRLSEGMKPLDNRRLFLQCFEAFKQFLN